MNQRGSISHSIINYQDTESYGTSLKLIAFAANYENLPPNLSIATTSKYNPVMCQWLAIHIKEKCEINYK